MVAYNKNQRLNRITHVLRLQLLRSRAAVVCHAHDHANRRQAGMVLATAALSTLAGGPATAAAAAPDCTFTKAPSGLQFCDTKEGTGDEAQSGTLVRVHYDGRLESNGSKFDSSYDRGEHFLLLTVSFVSPSRYCAQQTCTLPVVRGCTLLATEKGEMGQKVFLLYSTFSVVTRKGAERVYITCISQSLAVTIVHAPLSRSVLLQLTRARSLATCSSQCLYGCF